MNKVILYLLMLMGEVFICILSLLFLRDLEPTNLYVLNIIVLSVAYCLTFATTFDLFNDIDNRHTSRTAGLGVMWYGLLLYLLIGVGGVAASYIWSWDLTIALVVQFGALFILALFFALKYMTSQGVEEAEYNNNNRKRSLTCALESLNSLEADIKLDTQRAHRSQQIDSLKEQMRYITYSDREGAKDIDLKLANAFKELSMMRGTTHDDEVKWSGAVERCHTIIKLRKQQL